MTPKPEPNELKTAIDAVKRAPQDTALWDELERLGADAQKQETVAETYRTVLKRINDAGVVDAIGQRAMRWHEEWLGEDSKGLREVLERVLHVDPRSAWAFQRLTVLHTSKGRWDELLSVYDRAIERAEGTEEKRALLDEAANIAKDFAADADAAIRYLRELVRLAPNDKTLVNSLERQLERQERWRDLIELWRERIPTLPKEARPALELKIAECLYEKVGSAADAVESLGALFATGDRTPAALALLERIGSDDAVDAAVRRNALELLSRRYKAENRNTDLVRTLEAALELSEGDESTALHREAAQRLRAQGNDAEAREHYLAVLRLEPGATDALEGLRAIAKTTRKFDSLVQALDFAAERAPESSAAFDFRAEAAELLRGEMGDPEGAVTRYEQALALPGIDASARVKALRRLAKLFSDANRSKEELDILEQLSREEADAGERRAVAGRAARLAERLGEHDRALKSWRLRIETDPTDAEAIEAQIGILENAERYEELAEAVRARAALAKGSARGRGDRVKLAGLLADELDRIDDSLAVWKEISDEFGEDAETIDAMTTLLTRAERWPELADVLGRAATREAEHVAKVLDDAGRVQHGKLGKSATAAESYARALALFPEHLGAREGLKSLLDDPACERTAAEGLAEAYRRTDDWRGVVALTPVRVRLAATPEDRASILLGTAKVVESRGGDASAAFDYVAQALPLVPEDRAVESELLRLGRATDRERDIHTALETTVQNLERKSPRALALKARMAELLETELDAAADASRAYLELLEATPERRVLAEAALRTAIRAEAWDRAAKAVVLHSAARASLDEGLAADLTKALTTRSSALTASQAIQTSANEQRVEGKLGHDVMMWAANIAETNASDEERARTFGRRAVEFEPLSRVALETLVRLGRAQPTRELFDTLERVAGFDERNLDALHEAAEVASVVGVEPQVEERILRRLSQRSSLMWKDGIAATGTKQAAEAARFALERLSTLIRARGAHAELTTLATEAAALPFDEAERSAWLERAAAHALSAGERDRAVGIYRSLLDTNPRHSVALDALARLCEEDGRLPEMLALRRTELSFTDDIDRRLALRLDIVRLVGEIEKQGGRVDALHTNLRERPGHLPSIEALTQVLEQAGRHGDLADELTTQGRHLETSGDTSSAARIWSRVAVLSEQKLGDVDRAVQAYRRVVELQTTPQALDALARLRADHGDHASAAQWLERRLLVAEPDERTHIALRLARAHLAAGQRERALKCLESAFRENPSSPEIRETLADSYRSDERWESLAWVLTESAPHIQDRDALVRSAHEAAELYRGQGHLDRAIPILRRAAEVAPENRETRVLLGDALRIAGDHDGARQALAAVIEEFGRRRNAERAQVHSLLAHVEHAAGNLPQALEQLDLASGMDSSNAEILRTLGDFAFESGDLPRAERAYRALLLIVRRQAPGDDTRTVGIAEIQYALHRVAAKRGDDTQAKDLLRSATESALASDAETERLVRALVRWKDIDVALDVLERRLPETKQRVKLLSTLGTVLWNHANRGEEALPHFLDALDASPADDSLHRRVRALAIEVDGSRDYADRLRAIAAKTKEGDPRAGSETLLRLMRVLEDDVQDLPAAQAVCREIEALGQHRSEAWIAMARIAKADKDEDTELRALERLVAAPETSVPPSVRTDAMFDLAELRLHEEAGREEGIQLLSQALEREPRYTQVGSLLKQVGPGTDSSLMSLYGRVARSSTDQSILLDFLERRAARSEATIDEVREAVDLANNVGEHDRAQVLLERAWDLSGTSGGAGSRAWVAKQLTDQRFRAGDPDGAMGWVRKAAGEVSGEQALQLWLDGAESAARASALDAAAGVYAQLFPDHSKDRRVWEPYLAVLRQLGEADRFNEVISSVVEGMDDPAGRTAVRMERARYLLSLPEREADAAQALRDVLADDPGNTEAGKLLATLFERTGYDEDLAGLLSQQLDMARSKRDLETIKELSLKLGGLLGRVQRDNAMEVYRQALTSLPDDRDLAQGLLELFPEEHDPRERAITKERLLRSEEGAAASTLALELADEWTRLGDNGAVERVLELGYSSAPDSPEVRERLEGFFRDQGAWASLAGLLVREARRLGDRRTSVALFRNAASLYSESLGDAQTASSVLREAFEFAPDDVELLTELIAARTASGALSEAVEQVSTALARERLSDATRARLLAARGNVRLAMRDDADAISDLEQAYVLGGAAVGTELAKGLSQTVERAAQRGDRDGQRNATLRQVQVLSEVDQNDDARVILAHWVSESPRDREAVELLCAIDAGGERWDDLIESTRTLASMSEGDARSEAVLAHADACARAGRPGDARSAMEEALRTAPGNAQLRARLKKLYEDAKAHAELAVLLMEDAAEENDEDKRHGLLRRAGFLFLEAGNPDAGLPPLEEAVRLRPTDHEGVLLLVDGLIAAERFAEAGAILEKAIDAHPRRRSPELAALQLRMATLAQKAGDPNLQMQWLNAAMESDKGNGEIVARLAYLAMELKEYEVALNALRVVTLSKSEGPMSRAMAFLLQARIAHEQGEQRRALLWARKAKSEDPNLSEADEFLAQLGG